ncbi:uncharacterized protein DSM5745_03211 [Aspergillus mulundensis]|uniref:LEA domain protein n=1 Tax=Aspergillus mulundensis TaxID=1810919 RepID=A0A3D8SJP8_9EURO|nr:hypothetical protein DSM5745_03211 [Aspergillus mulundensis]RDW86569.1 hypothetical protein DSM5745_03211 [Aspergillus mulundensis]
MSFLARATRPARLPLTSSRLLSTTAVRSQGPIDATKSTLKKADRKVSDAAVKGIETGEAAASKIKETVGSGQAQKEAKEKAGELKGDAAELAGKAKGKGQEVAGEAKGKAKEVAGEFKSS